MLPNQVQHLANMPGFHHSYSRIFWPPHTVTPWLLPQQPTLTGFVCCLPWLHLQPPALQLVL